MPELSKLAKTTTAAAATSPLISRSESSLQLQLQLQLRGPSLSHRHISQLILAQTSPSQALQTFRWASLFPTFIHSQSTYRALVRKLCDFRQFGTVHQVLDEMPCSIGAPPDEDIFVTLVGGLARARMTRQVLAVLDLVHKFGKTPTLKLFNSILHVLVKEDIDLARKFYRRKMVGSGVRGDHYTFGILMKGLCLTNRIGDAFQLLQIIKSTGGSKPNTVVYNTLLFALCKNGKVGRARSLMSEMEDPNQVTFNILISGYCKDHNLVQALVMFDKGLSLGFVPDIVTITKVVELLCNAGRVTEAVEVLDRVEGKGGEIDVVAYNSLMKGFCSARKLKVASSLLKEMEGKGCLPNVDTYNVLISGFCESGMLDSALDFFNDMQTDGISPNFTTYDVLIRGLFLGGRMRAGFKILALMEDMKGGSGGCINPYNNILYGFYKKNLWDDALEFLVKMKKLFPKIVDRTLKILALCEQGTLLDAKMIFDQITNEGGIPSVLVYDCLIHGFCEEGQVREAFDLMNEMVGQGYLPVASTLNSIISEFCTQGKDGNALKLLKDMVKKGYIPNVQSYSPLIHGLCKSGNFHKGFGLFLQMVERGITPDCSTWNSLLLCPSQKLFLSKPKDLLHVTNLIESLVEARR